MLVNWFYILIDKIYFGKHYYPRFSLEYQRRKRQLKYIIHTPQWTPQVAEEFRHQYLWHKQIVDHVIEDGDEFFAEGGFAVVPMPVLVKETLPKKPRNSNNDVSAVHA
jgi:hypothetical protein